MRSYQKHFSKIEISKLQKEAQSYAYDLSLGQLQTKKDYELKILDALMLLDERNHITSREFALAIFTYLGMQNLLTSCSYLNNLRMKHLEKLYEIFSWTSHDPNSFLMDCPTFIRAFLFCNNRGINQWPRHHTLAEYIDFIYSHKDLLKGNLKLHLQTEVDEILLSTPYKEWPETPSYIFTLDGGRNKGDNSYGLILMLNVLDQHIKQVIHYPLLPNKKIMLEENLKQALSSETDLLFYSPPSEQKLFFRKSPPNPTMLKGYHVGQGWVASWQESEWRKIGINFFNIFNHQNKTFKLAYPYNEAYIFITVLPRYRFALLRQGNLDIFQIETGQAPRLHYSRNLAMEGYEENQLYNPPQLFNDRYVIWTMYSNSKSSHYNFSKTDIYFIDCEQNQDYFTQVECRQVGYNYLVDCLPSSSQVLFRDSDAIPLFMLDVNFSITGEIIDGQAWELPREPLEYGISLDGKYAFKKGCFYEYNPNSYICFLPKKSSPNFADKLKQFSFVGFIYDNRMLLRNKLSSLFICDAINESFKELKLPEGWQNIQPRVLPEGNVLLTKDNDYITYPVQYSLTPEEVKACSPNTNKLSHEIYQSLTGFPRDVCGLITNYAASLSLVGLFAVRQRSKPHSQRDIKFSLAAQNQP